MEIYKDSPVWGFNIDATDPFDKTISSDQGFQRIGYGKAITSAKRTVSIQGFTLKGVLSSLQEKTDYRDFFRNLRGSWRGFWVSLPVKQFEILEVNAGVDAITVEGNKLDEFYTKNYGRHVELYDLKGNYFRSKILLVTIDGDGNSVVTLDEEFPAWLTASCCGTLMYYVRNEDNNTSLENLTRRTAEYSMSVVELPFEANEDKSDITYNVQLYDFWAYFGGEKEVWRYTSSPFNITKDLGPRDNADGKLNRDYWLNIPGSSLVGLTDHANYPDSPTGRDTLNSSEGWGWDVWHNQNYGTDYGERIYGYIIPPETGNYKFYLTGDDQCELWLSSDSSTLNKAVIASIGTASAGLAGLVWKQYNWDDIPASEFFGGVKSAWTVLPNLDGHTPVRSGTVSNVDLSVSDETHRYALSFNGYVDVPESETYQFYLSSDDGSRLYIDDVQIIDNDGQHAAVEVQSSISLSAGLHKIRVDFFQWEGVASLSLSWSRPGVSKQIISAGYFRQSTQSGLSAARDWPNGAISAEIALVENTAYYMEIIHKEGGETDHVGVAWELPSDGAAPPSGSTNRILKRSDISSLSGGVPGVSQRVYESKPIDFENLVKDIDFSQDAVDIRMHDFEGNPFHGPAPIKLMPSTSLRVTEMLLDSNLDTLRGEGEEQIVNISSGWVVMPPRDFSGGFAALNPLSDAVQYSGSLGISVTTDKILYCVAIGEYICSVPYRSYHNSIIVYRPTDNTIVREVPLPSNIQDSYRRAAVIGDWMVTVDINIDRLIAYNPITDELRIDTNLPYSPDNNDEANLVMAVGDWAVVLPRFSGYSNVHIMSYNPITNEYKVSADVVDDPDGNLSFGNSAVVGDWVYTAAFVTNHIHAYNPITDTMSVVGNINTVVPVGSFEYYHAIAVDHLVVFPPYWADYFLVLDTRDNSMTISAEITEGNSYRFGEPCLVGDWVVCPPRRIDNVYAYNPKTNEIRISSESITGSGSDNYLSSAAVGDWAVFSPFDASNFAKYNPITNTLIMMDAHGNGVGNDAFSVPGVVLYADTEVIPGDAILERVMFEGELESRSKETDIWEASFRGISSLRASKLPTASFGKRCCKYIYDRRSGGVDKEKFRSSAKVIDIEGTSNQILESDDQTAGNSVRIYQRPSGYFDRGLLVLPATEEYPRQSRTIRKLEKIDGSARFKVYLNYPLYGIGGDDEFHIYPGSSNTVDNWEAIFDNFANTICHPEMPRENPSVSALPTGGGGGGK